MHKQNTTNRLAITIVCLQEICGVVLKLILITPNKVHVNLAKITEAGDISPSLTLSISCQSSSPITVPVHSPSVNSTLNYLILILLCIYFCYFAPQYFYLHIIICTPITPVLMPNFNYFTSMAYLLPYLPNITTFPLTVHIFYSCVIDCTFVYPLCNSMLLFLSHCFALSWPGRSCK